MAINAFARCMPSHERAAQYIRPHNDQFRSVAALVVCADNSRTATACSFGMLSPNVRHTLMRTAAAGTSRRLRLLPSRTGPSSFWRCRAKPTTTLHLLRNKYEQCSRTVAWWPYRCCSVRSVRSGRKPKETEIDMERAVDGSSSKKNRKDRIAIYS
jgi:hypothetical protein